MLMLLSRLENAKHSYHQQLLVPVLQKLKSYGLLKLSFLVHNSNHSCDGLPKLFQCMFPDSAIVKIFTIWPSKCAYYANSDVAHYLKDSLVSKVKAAPFYITSYGELLNRIFQEEQMDIHLHYFNKWIQMYYDSPFAARPNSDNLHKEFFNSLSVIGMK